MGTWIKRHRTKYVFNHEVESLDHVLEGVLSSSHSDPSKRDMIDKMAAKAADQHPANDVRAVLNLAISWVLQGQSELQVSSGFKLFSSWAQHHLPALESLLTRDLLVNLLTKASRNQANLPILLTQILDLLHSQGSFKAYQQHLKIIETKAAAYVQESPDVVSVKNYLHLLLKFKDSLPKGDPLNKLALPLIHALSSNPVPSEDRLVFQFIQDVWAVTEFLQQLWNQASSGSLLQECLKELFAIILTVEGPEPSVCLGALVSLVPSAVVETAVKTTVADPKLSDSSVNAALSRMIDWLVWPTCSNIDHWVVCFLKELAAAKKFSILISVTESKVEQVMEKLRYPPVREASFNILSHMLLSFQHCPQPFHKILPMVAETLDTVTREGGEGGREWRHRLANLLHCLMYVHTGFPDLYDPVLDLIKDVPRPSHEDMSARLAKSRWTGQHCESGKEDESAEGVEKSDTGRVGLVNLFNTCYMNSILQTLFMCDHFRCEALTQHPTQEEQLLGELQRVFATLLHSQRPAWRPGKFLEASRPPWFAPDQQQDCSEFLKYLLDQIHEQRLKAITRQPASGQPAANGVSSNGKPATSGKSKSENNRPPQSKDGCAATSPEHVADPAKDQTLVRQVFGFKVQSTYRCLACQQESHRLEDFLDIPLAFPDTGVGSVSSPKALAGGGSHLPQGEAAKQQGSAPGKAHGATAQEKSDKSAKTTHLSELLAHYLKPEQLVGDNQYHCDHCGKLQDAERTIGIVNSPQYLILILCRFAFDAKLQTRSKVFREVACPRTLAVPVLPSNTSPNNNKTATTTTTNNNNNNNTTTSKRRKKLLHHLQSKLPDGVSPPTDNCDLYGLCSVIVHSGASSECGHYYCYSRPSQLGNVDSVMDGLDTDQSRRADLNTDGEVDFLQEKWCLFNDMRVSAATYASFSKLSERFPSDTPYVLVYRKLPLDASGSRVPDDPPAPSLRQELRDAVNQDNAAYFKEQEQATKTKARRTRTSSSSSVTFESLRDHDATSPGPSAGSYGLGALDTSARFVY